MGGRGRLLASPIFYIFVIALIALYWFTPRGYTSIPAASWASKAATGFAPGIGSADAPPRVPHLTSTDHPIKQLHHAATLRFETLVSSQSSTLTEAVDQYRKRYGRAPPPGFDAWYKYAVQHNSVIIDDFDMIDEAMKPFWDVEPSVIKRIMRKAANGDIVDMFVMHKGQALSGDNWMGARIGDVLGNVTSALPDFEILMNPLDEPRILLGERPSLNEVRWEDYSQMPSWEQVTAPCKYKKSPNTLPIKVDTHGIPFMVDNWAQRDVCQNPSFESQHGFFISPATLITTDSPVPILSQAMPSTFSDILYPSMWYWDHVIENLKEFDPPWQDKFNKLYWAGSTTGAFIVEIDEGLPHWVSHRHRFIKLTKQIGSGVYKFLTRSKEESPWTSYDSEEILAQLYATKFTKLLQCAGPECDTAEAEYKFGEQDPVEYAFDHKFLMDMDGNSFSGRFYNFIASNSCPLKQTIFREWHDERLIPWAHYIPISVSLEDLPETMRYLSLTTEGTEIAQAVAALGHEWHDKLLRKEDAAIYLYRLFLEYVRVMDNKRDEMNFALS